MANLRYRRRPPDQREKFILPHRQHAGPKPGPEILPWYWHPNRDGVRRPDSAFQARLAAIDPDLAVVFSPVHERWIIWAKEDRIGHEVRFGAASWLCPGWRLLFLWEHPVTNAYLPLNDLVFHNIYMVSANRYPSAKVYFDRIQQDIEREKAARNATLENNRQAKQSEFRDSLQISSAGRGNRFALHESTGVPSRGELNWRAETRKLRMPSEQLKREQDEKEQRFYGK